MKKKGYYEYGNGIYPLMLSGRATEDVAFLSRFRVRRLCR